MAQKALRKASAPAPVRFSLRIEDASIENEDSSLLNIDDFGATRWQLRACKSEGGPHAARWQLPLRAIFDSFSLVSRLFSDCIASVLRLIWGYVDEQHSLCYGLGLPSAPSLRKDIANFIAKNPDLEIAGDPLKDWIEWDGGGNVSSYTRKMGNPHGPWGGGIEMAACSRYAP